MMDLLVLWCTFVSAAFSLPISQPAYQNVQYTQAQLAPQPLYKQQQQQPLYKQQQQQPLYKQQQQPQPQTLYLEQVQQYLRPQPQPQQQPQVAPVYEIGSNEGLREYSSQQARPQHILLAANAVRERPLQPPYVQHSLAAQAQEAFAATATQRKAQQAAQQVAQQVAQQTSVPVQQPEHAQVKYVTRPAAAPVQYAPQRQQRPQQLQQRPQQLQQLRDKEEEKEDYDPNPSYQFGFDVKDDQFTNYQNRKEQREGNKITGSYSVVDSDGFIRTVSYTADPKEGFKAEVTRQPTDIVVKIPKPLPQFQSSPRQPLQYAQEARPRQEQRQQSNVIYQYQ